MPATVGTLRVHIVGDLLPVARAFGIMAAALAAYGHAFTDDEMTILGHAAAALAVQTDESLVRGVAFPADRDT